MCVCVCVTEVSAVDAINLAEINKQNQQSNSKPQTKGVEPTEVGLQSVWKWEGQRGRKEGREPAELHVLRHLFEQDTLERCLLIIGA